MIKYWVNECAKEFNIDKHTVYNQFKQLDNLGMLHIIELDDKKGVVAYMITPDLKGGLIINEMFMYIKPEHRGNPRNLLRLIGHLEEAGKANKMAVHIASGFDFRDNKLIQLLLKRGYTVHTAKKEF